MSKQTFDFKRFSMDAAAMAIFWTILYTPLFLYTSRTLEARPSGLDPLPFWKFSLAEFTVDFWIGSDEILEFCRRRLCRIPSFRPSFKPESQNHFVEVVCGYYFLEELGRAQNWKRIATARNKTAQTKRGNSRIQRSLLKLGRQSRPSRMPS